MSISDIDGTIFIFPTMCSREITSIKELQLVEYLRLERIVIDGIDYDTTLAVESPGCRININ